MANLTRREFLQIGATAVMGATLLPVINGRSTYQNFVLIAVDDLGFGDLSCYGATDVKTPHIDALAARGQRFTNFYANSPVCSPTRASILTGRYPDFVGVPGVIRTDRENSWGRLSDEAVLLPQLLKEHGYHTACIGKWHLGLEAPDTPNDRGFDLFHGWLGDMMDDYYTHRRHDINYMRRDRETIDPDGHATDLFTDWACDYLDERSGKLDEPFFLYLAYNAPHTPIQPPSDSLERVKKREPDMPEDRAKLVALIEHMDEGLGRILSTLDKGSHNPTTVIFLSDNGGQLNQGASNGPLRGGKQDMYEGGIRVPMIWSGDYPRSTGRYVFSDPTRPGTNDTLAMTMDILPTICSMTEAPISYNADGIKLLSNAFTGPDHVYDRKLFGMERPVIAFTAPHHVYGRTLFWMRREGGDYGGRAYYAARKGKFKLLQNSPFEPMMLYDLDQDPRETAPLHRDHPMYEELFEAIRQHINEASRIPWQREDVSSP
jgi:arylsulfatase A-like enzyme